jgi:hypothetical protein
MVDEFYKIRIISGNKKKVMIFYQPFFKFLQSTETTFGSWPRRTPNYLLNLIRMTLEGRYAGSCLTPLSG